MKYIQLLLCLAFLSFLFNACSSTNEEEQTSNITADFYFRYLASDKQYRAEATFFEEIDGKKKSKQMSAVSFNSQKMKARNLPNMGTRYRIDKINQAAPSQLIFECIDQGDVPHDFNINLSPISKFQLKSPIQKFKGFTIQWDGKPLADNEELVFLFTDSKNKGFTETLKGPTNESSIQFPVTKTTQFKPGSGLLSLVRKTRQIKQQPGWTDDITIEFYANSIPIEIIE